MVICLLILLVVLVQNPKGGGLGSAFGASGATAIGGVKQTNDFLEKTTWTLAIALFVLTILMNAFIPNTSSLEGESSKTKIENILDNNGE